MKYPINLYEIETTDGMQWVAEFPDVEGCVGGGDTPEEALEDARINLEFHLEGLKELGLPIPEPSRIEKESFSGKLSLRLSKGMHKKVSQHAKLENVSINQFIVEAVSEKIGFSNARECLKTDLEKTIEKVFKTSNLKLVHEISYSYKDNKIDGFLNSTIGGIYAN